MRLPRVPLLMTFPSLILLRTFQNGGGGTFPGSHTFHEFLLSLTGDRSLPTVATYNIRVLESWKPVGIIEFIRLVFIIRGVAKAFRYFLLLFLPSFLSSLSKESLVPFALFIIVECTCHREWNLDLNLFEV